MSQGRKICVFSLSKKDPTFRSAVSINGPIEWLNSKKNPPHRYYFRSTKPDSLPNDSKVLFSFENQIFGEATIKEEVQSLTPTDKEMPETFSGYYQKFVTLDPDSIKIYRFHPTKSELLENENFADYQFSQLFSYLSLQQYREILKMAER
jgi:CRISPR/Cas system CMR-associated protein Cmr1 (group 7 of RAMP superfamily)